MIDTSSSSIAPNVKDLIYHTEQLGNIEFEAFFSKVISINAHRKAPGLSTFETVLLKKINTPVPSKKMDRFVCLDQKRQDETLNADEHKELLNLVRYLGRFDAERMKTIGQLAILKKMPLNDLMAQLGLFNTNNG
jgi:hypothetical protein